jgi:hypothetical protein
MMVSGGNTEKVSKVKLSKPAPERVKKKLPAVSRSEALHLRI